MRRALRSIFSKARLPSAARRFAIELSHPEGAWVGAGDPILHVTGPLFHLVDLETVLLQKLGPACVAAYNAYAMCAELPKVAFLAMDARHCAGAEMAEMMAYAASVGSAHAQREAGAVGFVGCAADATAGFFGQPKGAGTMPHALIGYAGSTVRAAEMFREVFPDEPMTVLIDYFGHETSDAVAVARRFPDARRGGPACRAHRHPRQALLRGAGPGPLLRGARAHAPQAIRGYRSEEELRHLVGTGVSAAAIWLLRRTFDEAGFPAVKIVASSGFGPAKCRMMAARQCADRRDRHRLLPARAVERDLCDGRHHRLSTACRWSRPAASFYCVGADDRAGQRDKNQAGA